MLLLPLSLLVVFPPSALGVSPLAAAGASPLGEVGVSAPPEEPPSPADSFFLLAVGGGAAVVLVEAAALERDADAAEDVAERAGARRARRQGVVGELLHDLEVLAALLAGVLVGGHPGIPFWLALGRSEC